MELNAYPKTDKYPEIVFPKITKIDIGDYADVISEFFNAGTLTYDLGTERAVREYIGLPQIDKPGLMLKPNLPAEESPGEPPEGKQVGDATLPKEQKVKGGNDKTVKASEFSDAAKAKEVSSIIDQIALRMISTYDKVLKQLPKDLEAKNEDDWADLVDWYANEVYEALQDKLNEEMIAAWRSFTDDKPKPKAYKVIIDELFVQSDYLKNSLMPALKEKVIQTAHDAQGNLIGLAVAGAIGSLRYRVGTYANSIFKIFGNQANAYLSKKRMDSTFPDNDIEMDWDIGILKGPELIARYVGADDQRTCNGCDYEMDKGWVRPEQLVPIGDNECGNNCRHVLQYKYRSRIF
jgi:hypothetical protein